MERQPYAATMTATNGDAAPALEERSLPAVSRALEHLPDVLTVEEVARVLRLSRNGAYQAVDRREIPSIRIGRRVLVPKRQLLQLLGQA